jgi:RHS repeat-associated protein
VPGSPDLGTLAAYSWTFDANGRITSTSNPDGTTSYTYDNGGQLTGADHSYQTDETYTFDANGNRTMSGYTTGTNNRLTSDGTYNYQYDAEGNRTRRTHITTDATVDYAWDHRNRLTAVTFKTSAGVTTKQVEYSYDVFDRRLSQRVDTNGDGTFDVAYRYAYDSAGKLDPATGVPLDDIVFVFTDSDGDGPSAATLSNRLLHGPSFDQVFADENSLGEVLWSLTDHQGTVRDVAKYNAGTDTTSIVNHRQYDSFGRITSETNPGGGSPAAFLHAYTGREWDADAGLFYHRMRWYDPAVGRFISDDPLGFRAGDPNVQRYVANNPVNWIDPAGLEGGPGQLPKSDATQAMRDFFKNNPFPANRPTTEQLEEYKQMATKFIAKKQAEIEKLKKEGRLEQAKRWQKTIIDVHNKRIDQINREIAMRKAAAEAAKKAAAEAAKKARLETMKRILKAIPASMLNSIKIIILPLPQLYEPYDYGPTGPIALGDGSDSETQVSSL